MIWNAKNGTIPIGNTKMSYVSFGLGKKVLILLPGLSDGLATVDGKALLLAIPYKLFFKDYTLFMFSRKNNLPDNYSIREMADDQAEAMRKLGIEKASVLGVSEGGMIAQYLAINHADLIDRLVIAVSAPNANDIVHSVVESWIGLAKLQNHKQLMINTAEKSYSEAYLKKYRKIYPVIGWIGKPKNYDRFLINANAILNFDCFNDLKKLFVRRSLLEERLIKSSVRWPLMKCMSRLRAVNFICIKNSDMPHMKKRMISTSVCLNF